MRLLVLGNPDSIWTREFIEFALKRPDRKISVLYDAQAKGAFAGFYASLGVEVIRTPPVSSIIIKRLCWIPANPDKSGAGSTTIISIPLSI